MSDDFFEHYGIKGMRWGVRKDSGSSGRKSGVSKLSNEELKSRVQRLNLEKQYSSLTRQNAGSLEKGARAVQGILQSAGKQIVTTALVVYGGKAIKYGVTAILGARG